MRASVQRACWIRGMMAAMTDRPQRSPATVRRPEERLKSALVLRIPRSATGSDRLAATVSVSPLLQAVGGMKATEGGERRNF